MNRLGRKIDGGIFVGPVSNNPEQGLIIKEFDFMGNYWDFIKGWPALGFKDYNEGWRLLSKETSIDIANNLLGTGLVLGELLNANFYSNKKSDFRLEATYRYWSTFTDGNKAASFYLTRKASHIEWIYKSSKAKALLVKQVSLPSNFKGPIIKVESSVKQALHDMTLYQPLVDQMKELTIKKDAEIKKVEQERDLLQRKLDQIVKVCS